MTIPFGHLRLNINLRLVSAKRHRWEDLVSAGMDDRELSRLNKRNTSFVESAHSAGQRFLINGHWIS